MTKHPHSTIPLDGKVYGFLTVLHREGSTRWHQQNCYATWRCRCTCGQEVVVIGQHLRQGRRKACAVDGHYWRQRPGSLSARSHPVEYQCWEMLKARCYRKGHHRFKSYGGRGIKVCRRWKKSFDNFFADMGPKPPGLTIERIDVNGDYEPDNCRWVAPAEQRRNLQNSVYVVHEGQRMLLLDVPRQPKLTYQALYARLRMGWTLPDALAVPVRPKRKRV